MGAEMDVYGGRNEEGESCRLFVSDPISLRPALPGQVRASAKRTNEIACLQVLGCLPIN
jgi:hypothetical protein